MIRLLLSFSLISFFSLAVFAFEKADLWKNSKKGRYSDSLEKIYDNWLRDKKNLNFDNSTKIHVQAIPSEDDATYVGIMAQAVIPSTVEKIMKVLNDVKNYQKIYFDLEEVKVESEKSPDLVIDWKFGGALGTHTRYKTVQRLQSKGKDRAAMIYQLKSSDEVLEADGIILFQEIDGKTKYLSIDFFNAKWGIAGTFFKNKIWDTTCKSTVKTTLAIAVSAGADVSVYGAEKELLEECAAMIDRKKRKNFETLSEEIQN